MSKPARLDPNEVRAAMIDCLYKPEEITSLEKGTIPKNAVAVNWVDVTFCLHPERLKDKRQKVFTWLQSLPRGFRQGVGGGMAITYAQKLQDGTMWTLEAKPVQELFILGMGLGMVEFCEPSAVWKAMGIPYLVILDVV